MEDCIFCKISKKDIDSAIIWEDDEFLAILDINPNTKGMAVVLTKQHYSSYAFDMPEAFYKKFMSAARKAAKMLEKGLGVKRVAMVMEGMGVNHAHIKLYPLHGLADKSHIILAKEKIFFDRYDGYISTQMGPAADISELKNLADEIKRKQG